MKKPHPKRQPGRPSGSPDSRQAILNAARQAFVAHGFRGASLRKIAEAAGVTPAMAHYHFKDKAGLYIAVIEETAGPLLEKLTGLANASDSGEEGVGRFFQTYMEAIAAHPELPMLLLRDVLSEGAPMRDTFIKQYASRAGHLLGTLVRQDQQTGRLNPDLDPHLLVLSLISMALFPFLASPVFEQALGIKLNDASVQQLIRHNQALFLNGARKHD